MKNILQSLLASCLLAITLVSLLLTTSRAQAQTLTVLYAFKGGSDGSKPAAGLVRDTAGNLYGTTPYGGASGFGTVFKVDAAGNETVLYSFTGQPDGDTPFAALVRDAAGISTALPSGAVISTMGLSSKSIRRAMKPCCTGSVPSRMGKVPSV